MPTTEEFFDAGLKLRRDMFGPPGADQQIDNATDFTAPMQDLVTRFCFGEVWHRPLLDRKTRSLMTIALVTALGKPNQVKVHVRGAIANGATPDEIRETLMHTMVYAGVPQAVDAFGHAAETLKDMGLEGKKA